MTVAELTPTVAYLENGVTLAFPVPFRFLAHTLTAERIPAGGTPIVLVEGADYAVTGGDTDAGGTLTLVSSMAGATLYIGRDTPVSQQMDYDTADTFPAESHEDALDKLTLIAQEQGAGLHSLESRALRVPIGEEVDELPPAGDRAQGILGFDGDGQPLIFPSSELGSITVTAQRVEHIALAGQTVFKTNVEYQVGYLGVYVNGVRLSEQEFTATNGIDAVLDEGLQAGDVVLLEGFLGSDVVGDAAGITFTQAGAGAVQRTVESKLRESVSICDYGASPGNSAAGNSAAINQAIATAMVSGRALYVPPGTYNYNQLDFVKNNVENPVVRLVIHGEGTLRSTFAGTSMIASAGKFYDLVIDGVRFESVAGAGTALIDGRAFYRLILTPGTQVLNFDEVIYCPGTNPAVDYLQSVRMIGCIVRGGNGAVMRAAVAYDCRVTHCIIEHRQDGIVIGEGAATADPACHVCTFSDNVIEGLTGRGIAVGPCLSTQICGNYMEDNAGAEILLNLGPAAHKGLRVSDNGLQQSAARIAAGAYSIVWGASLAIPCRAGGNFCTGHLHDISAASSILDTIGDFVSAGKNLVTPNTARRLSTDGIGFSVDWFGRKMALDPFFHEVRFAGKYDSGGQSPVITFGTNSPANDPAQFDRKTWARGSLVLNPNASASGQVWGFMCLVAGTPGTWSYLGVVP